MLFMVCCDTLTGQLDSVCTCGNANGLVVVVSFAVVDAGAFVRVVFEVGHVLVKRSVFEVWTSN